MSTIFISHSSKDNALAIELVDWLKSQGYRSVFLDLDPEEGIETGEKWEKVLYRELVSCSVVLALVTENWQTSKWCFAEVTHARSGGKTLLGFIVNRSVKPLILSDTQLINYNPDKRDDAYQRLGEALRRAIDPQGLGRWDSARPLFPGLMFFDEQDAPIFFGHRRLGQMIYQKLQELRAKPPGSERLLLVFGPSGSGKSSVVRAGTLPHIRINLDAWITLGPFRPIEGWPEPLRQNMVVLTGSNEEAATAKLHEIADQLRNEAKVPKAVILLIIDQLEEALDAKVNAEAAFWLPLSRLLAPKDTPFMVMATLRSDFMGDFQKRSTHHTMRFSPFPIEPMSPKDIREAIAGPCRMAGIDIEPGLVDTLVEDASDEQALPLLALVLNRLWLRYEAKQGVFTVSEYREGLGGMQGLIDREAESTLTGSGLREDEVMNAFLNLIRQVRDGVFARQPAAWSKLQPEAQKSLEPFIRTRLLVRYGSKNQEYNKSDQENLVVIELVHEAFLGGWARLHRWLTHTENRSFLLWREEFRYKVSRWSNAEDKKALLLAGAELKEAKQWLKAKRIGLEIQEINYIQTSLRFSRNLKIKYALFPFVLFAAAVISFIIWILTPRGFFWELEFNLRQAAPQITPIQVSPYQELPKKSIRTLSMIDALNKTNVEEFLLQYGREGIINNIELLIDVGLTRVHFGDEINGIKILRHAYKMIEQINVVNMKSILSSKLSGGLVDLGNNACALKVNKIVFKELEMINRPELKVLPLVAFALSKDKINKNNIDSKILTRKSIQIVEGLNDPKQKIFIFSLLAMLIGEHRESTLFGELSKTIFNGILQAITEFDDSPAKLAALNSEVFMNQDLMKIIKEHGSTFIKPILKIIEEISDINDKNITFNNAALFYARIGDKENALMFLKRGYQLKEVIKNDRDKLAFGNIYLANLSSIGRDFNDQDIVDQAYQAAQSISDTEFKNYVLQLINDDLSVLKDKQAASQTLKQMADAIDREDWLAMNQIRYGYRGLKSPIAPVISIDLIMDTLEILVKTRLSENEKIQFSKEWCVLP